MEILDTDTVHEIAIKIFKHFEINQSCTIKGYVVDISNEDVLEKGLIILNHLERLDIEENTTGKTHKRKGLKIRNSVGGFVAQKIFKFKREMRNNIPVYQFWRFQ